MKVEVGNYDIMQYLNSKHINPANLGYDYLRDAIKIACEDETYRYKITAVYAQIAKRHNSTASRVERAIRHSLESNGESKIKNRDFIATAVNHFLMEFEKLEAFERR